MPAAPGVIEAVAPLAERQPPPQSELPDRGEQPVALDTWVVDLATGRVVRSRRTDVDAAP